MIENKKKEMVRHDLEDMKRRNHLEQRHLQRLVEVVDDIFEMTVGIDDRLDQLENNVKEEVIPTIIGMGEAEKYHDILSAKLEKLEEEKKQNN